MKNYVKMFESWVLNEEAEYGTREAAGTFSEQIRMVSKMTAADFTRLGRKKSGDLIADLIGYLVPSGAFQKEKQTIRYNESTGAFEWSPNPEHAWHNFGLEDHRLRGRVLTLGLPEIAMNTKPGKKESQHPNLYDIDSIGNYSFAECPILYVTHLNKSSNLDIWAAADVTISIAELLKCMTNSLIDGAWTDIKVFIPKFNRYSSDLDFDEKMNENLKTRMEIIKRDIWPSVYKTLIGLDAKRSPELAKKIQRPIGDYDAQGQQPGAKMNAYNP